MINLKQHLKKSLIENKKPIEPFELQRASLVAQISRLPSDTKI